MTFQDLFQIDWREQIRRLEPALNGRQPLTLVSGGPHAAAHQFIERVRWEIGQRQGRDVLFSSSDPASHTQNDIATLLCRSLGITPKNARGGICTLSVGNNVSAQSVTLSGNTFALPAEHEMPVVDLRTMVQDIEGSWNNQPLVLLFDMLEPWSERMLRWLWREFWQTVASPLQPKGVSMICFASDAHCSTLGPPRCDDVIHLPDRYDDSAFEHAVEDASRYLAANDTPTENHRQQAMGMIAMVERRPEETLRRLPLARFNMGGRR